MFVPDIYGRKFEKLRISLTNECNFNCIYCVGRNHIGTTLQSTSIIPPSSFQKLSAGDYKNCIDAIHRLSPLKQIRFTGGEPLLSQHLIELIHHAKNLEVKDVGLTTNAAYLTHKIKPLLQAGIDSLNVSLDGIDDDVIKKMAGVSKLNSIKETIIIAKNAGLPVKINSVIMKDKNQDQILPLLEFARKNLIPIRFIEFMKMGHFHDTTSHHLVRQQTILNEIGKRYSFKPLIRRPGSTANYWELAQGGIFGIIANYSAPFCSDCNRLRLDSTGNLYGCLSSRKGLNILKAMDSEEELNRILTDALSQKQSKSFTGSSLSMKYIGG